MLLAVTMVFIVCQSIKLIPDAYEVFGCKPFHYEIGECPHSTTQIFNIMAEIAHLFLAINSCMNFPIYAVVRVSVSESIVKVRKEKAKRINYGLICSYL